MVGIAGIVAFIIAGILQLTGKDTGAVIWCVIIGGILVGIEATWGWYRGGRTYRP